MRSTNLRAERWINKGVALVCSECETTETSQRYANRDDKGKPVCYVCYMLQLAVSHGKCSGCSNDGGNTSQLRRSKVEKDAWYCMPCIHREELDIAAAAGTKCVTCGTDNTILWHNCKDKPGTKVCRSCYEKNKLDVAAAAGTTCVKCGTDTARRWYSCKDKPGTKLCMPCYEKNLLDVAAAAGTACVKCRTDTTSKWLDCKDEPGTKICLRCYDKNRYEKKKAASANEE